MWNKGGSTAFGSLCDPRLISLPACGRCFRLAKVGAAPQPLAFARARLAWVTPRRPDYSGSTSSWQIVAPASCSGL
jgi:hypothetical protein